MRNKDELTREDILMKAQILFRQYGLKKTTMDDIAKACNKAKSTLYHYYKSKGEVFDAVLQNELNGLREAVKSEVDKEVVLKNKLSAYVIVFHQELIKRMNLYRIVRQEVRLGVFYKEHFNSVMLFERKYINHLLLNAYKSGEFKEFNKDDIPWMSEILIAAFMGIVRYTIEKEDGFDIEKLQYATQLLIPKVFG